MCHVNFCCFVVGGPGIQTAPKRHSTPVTRSVTMREPETKRKPTPSVGVLTKNTSPAESQVRATPNFSSVTKNMIISGYGQNYCPFEC